jgi:EAL domain-containing protein (putative c-di-GMP-specific phosphodiesterase class I)
MSDDLRDLVLLIDDDFAVRQMHARMLTRAGFRVETANSGAEGLNLLERGLRVGAIITDLHMPGIDGLAFMRAVRKFDLDVPVIVVTGYPSLESAMRVIEYGGFRYFTKPAQAAELVNATRSGMAMHRLACLKRRALELYESERWHFGDRASLETTFDEAIDRLWMAFQPIVNHKKREIIGYEALVRSHHPVLGSPGPLLGAAERLGRVTELGRRIRRHVVDAVTAAPIETLIFMNLHAADLNDDDLYSQTSALAGCAPRVVLEVTERSSLDRVSDVQGRAQALRRMGFKLAIDDLGAGYAGLSSFAQLEPDIAKVDMSLIRDIDNSSQKQSIVRSMLTVCRNELAVDVVCEGVETEAERDCLDGLGCDTQQGYLFGRPSATFAMPTWHEDAPLPLAAGAAQ